CLSNRFVPLRVILCLLVVVGLLGALSFGACQRASAPGSNSVMPIVTAKPTNAPAPPTPTPTPTLVPLKLPLVAPRIVVSKSARRLVLYSDGRIVRTYTIALGLNPTDDKERQ